VYAYDPYKNKWRALAALPAALGFSGGAVADGLVFMEGGYGSAGSVTTNQYLVITPSIP
jgi:N-acetylneuraminic acid mutarotase